VRDEVFREKITDALNRNGDDYAELAVEIGKIVDQQIKDEGRSEDLSFVFQKEKAA